MSKSKLSKFFKGKATQATIPDSAKSQPVPRQRDEINKNYQDVCTALGDKQVKAKGLQQEIDQLFKYVESLANELSARETLDAKAKEDSAKAKAAEAVGVPGQDLDQSAPSTSGVDVQP